MDDIKEKLNQISEQLESTPQKLFEKAAVSAPLVFCAVGLIAGIILENIFTLTIFFWLTLLIVCIIGMITILKITHKFQIYVLCTFVCFICLGGIRLISFQQPASNDICNIVGEERQLATVRGIILSEPYTAQPEWEFAKFSYTDPRSSFYLKLKEIETVDGWVKATGTVRVQVNESIIDLKAGDYIEAFCWLDRFKSATNPGQFDVAKYLARNRVYIAAAVESRDSITLLENYGTASFVKIKSKLTAIASARLLGSPDAYEQNQKLLQALVLGQKSNISSDIYLAFRKTGLLHFLCLSGMNFAIVIGIVWWLCRIAGLSKPARAAVCLIAATLFLLVVPPQAPTLRAAIVCFVFCLSFFFQRRPNPINSLSLAAIVLLLINPMQLYEAGWQLSFAAVLGILLLTDRISYFLYEKITGRLWVWEMPKTKWLFRIVARPGPAILNCFAVPFAAWLATSGIMLYQFYTLNILTTLWTIIVSPLIAVVSILGYTKMTLAFVMPTAASYLGTITLILADWLIRVVKFIANLDNSEILMGHVPLVFIIFYYAAIFFAAFARFRQRRIKFAVASVMFLTIIAFLGITKFQRTHRDNLIMTCLNVGHGQAIVAQMPGGKTYLFDAGSQNTSDIGTRIIAPFLNYNGIGRLDGIFISHSDIDHINGIPEVVKFCKVDAVYAGKTVFESEKPTIKLLKNYLVDKKVEIKSNKDKIDNVKFLWPDDNGGIDKQLNENDKSTVILIEPANAKILLCSDIEKTAQAAILQLYPNLRPDVVIAPHHGSLKTRLPDFLETIDPDILIYSCGQRLFDSLKKTNPNARSKSFFTCDDGAITISIDARGGIKTIAHAHK